MTLLFMTSFGSPLKPRSGLKSGTEQDKERVEQLTHSLRQTAVVIVGRKAVCVNVVDCVTASDENRHPVVEILLFRQKETAIADMFDRAECFIECVPAIAKLVLPGTTDFTKKLLSLAESC
jgi:hypothetical protein